MDERRRHQTSGNAPVRQRQPREKDAAHLVRYEDISGRRFGRLIAVSYLGPIHNTSLWLMRCDCGNEKKVRRSNLNSTRSCGCLVRERVSETQTTHGLSRPGQLHYLYGVWDSMKRRCHGKRPHPRYGGRGIYVCDRWRFGEGEKTGFECFLEDMGDRPSKGHSIDRKDYNGPYIPENCRWATQVEQQRNRSTNRMVMYRGRGMTLTEAIELSGLTEQAVWARLHRGWSISDALDTPKGQKPC